MTVNILDFGDTVPSSREGATPPILINASQQTIASFSINLGPGTPLNNRVELNATVGVAATLSIPQVVFKIVRDGTDLIFATQQGMQFATEQFYAVKMTAVDFNVPQGAHTYSLTVQRLTGDTASVAGPITFGGIAFGPIS